MPHRRSTFPLDDEEIRSERWRVTLTSPVTWLPLVGVIALGFLFKPPPLVMLVGLAAVAIGLLLYWRTQAAAIERRIADKMVRDSNQRQDRAIASRIGELAESGREGYAITLGKFLGEKRAIESELHKDGVAEDDEQNIERLVDELCAGVAEQFATIADIERRQAAINSGGDEHGELEATRRELLGQVVDSFKSLKRTRKELAYILDPTKVAAAHGRPVRDLGKLSEDLRAEEEIARRTRERLQRDSIGT